MKNTKSILIAGLFSTVLFAGQSSHANDLNNKSLDHFKSLQTADTELPWIKGKVVKISQKRGIVTIAHDEIVNLSMPSMTMGFRTEDSVALNELKPGDKIEFQTQEVDGKLKLVHYRSPAS